MIGNEVFSAFDEAESNNEDEVFLAFDEAEKRFFSFVSNGKDQLMVAIKYILFNPSPDFLGIPHLTKPIFFGLHPDYAFGNEWMLTLDFQVVPRHEATGEVSEEQ